MPVIDVENLTDLEKAKMELEQKKKEVQLERAMVSSSNKFQIIYMTDMQSLFDSKCFGPSLAKLFLNQRLGNVQTDLFVLGVMERI